MHSLLTAKLSASAVACCDRDDMQSGSRTDCVHLTQHCVHVRSCGFRPAAEPGDCVCACPQAVRNEDTRGDAAQLRLEIRRIKQQLQAWKDAALAAGVAPEGFAVGPESGGSGEVQRASSSRGSSRRGSSQRKGSVLNPGSSWDELVSSAALLVC